MKRNAEQLMLNFPRTPPLRSSPSKGTNRNFRKVVIAERMRDSEGKFTTGDCEDVGDDVERIKRENEMLTRKYLAVSKLLASAEREILKLKEKI